MATSEFGKAFAAARKSGAKSFEFGGKKYTTELKKPSTDAKPAAPTKLQSMQSAMKSAPEGEGKKALMSAEKSERNKQMIAAYDRAPEGMGKQQLAASIAKNGGTISRKEPDLTAQKIKAGKIVGDTLAAAAKKESAYAKGGLVKKPATKATPKAAPKMAIGKAVGKSAMKPTGMKTGAMKLSCGGMVKKKK